MAVVPSGHFMLAPHDGNHFLLDAENISRHIHDFLADDDTEPYEKNVTTTPPKPIGNGASGSSKSFMLAEIQEVPGGWDSFNSNSSILGKTTFSLEQPAAPLPPLSAPSFTSSQKDGVESGESSISDLSLKGLTLLTKDPSILSKENVSQVAGLKKAAPSFTPSQSLLEIARSQTQSQQAQATQVQTQTLPLPVPQKTPVKSVPLPQKNQGNPRVLPPPQPKRQEAPVKANGVQQQQQQAATSAISMVAQGAPNPSLDQESDDADSEWNKYAQLFYGGASNEEALEFEVESEAQHETTLTQNVPVYAVQSQKPAQPAPYAPNGVQVAMRPRPRPAAPVVFALQVPQPQAPVMLQPYRPPQVQVVRPVQPYAPPQGHFAPAGNMRPIQYQPVPVSIVQPQVVYVTATGAHYPQAYMPQMQRVPQPQGPIAMVRPVQAPFQQPAQTTARPARPPVAATREQLLKQAQQIARSMQPAVVVVPTPTPAAAAAPTPQAQEQVLTPPPEQAVTAVPQQPPQPAAASKGKQKKQKQPKAKAELDQEPASEKETEKDKEKEKEKEKETEKKEASEAKPSAGNAAAQEEETAAVPLAKKGPISWANVAKITAKPAATETNEEVAEEPTASGSSVDGWTTVKATNFRPASISAQTTATASQSSKASQPPPAEPSSKSNKNWTMPTVVRNGRAIPEVLKKYNLRNYPLNPESAHFFVIKSYSEEDIHKSIKYSIWASTDQVLFHPTS